MQQVHYQQNKNMKPVCMFFLQGRCNRAMCVFKHPGDTNTNQQTSHSNIPVCKRGPTCYFKAQNTCFYAHLEEESNRHMNNNHKTKLCKHGDECWNISTCTFIHNSSKKDFQSDKNKRISNQRVNSVWQNY